MEDIIKILVDAHIFDHSYQGTTTYIKGLYNALAKNEKVEITFCACNLENLKIHFPDVKFKFIKLNSHSRIRRLFIEYPSIIRKGNYDYSHFQYIVPPIKKSKYINTIHDVVFLDYKKYFPLSYRISKGVLYSFSALRSDILMTVSEYSRKAIIKHFGIKSQIYVTPNAVEVPSPANPVDIKNRYNLDKYILYVSRFEPRKNQIGLLKSYLELELYKQGYSLVFIGSKKEKIEQNSYNQLMNSIPEQILSYIRFFEGINQEELESFYQKASCFVYPSLFEGFGIPPLEAAVNGCKVLCSNQTAMADFDFFKYRVDPNKKNELTEKLSIILKDENYPFQSIKDAVMSKYHWEIIAQGFYNVLKDNYKLN